MRRVQITSTSTADLSTEYFDKRNIKFLSNVAVIDEQIVVDDYSYDYKEFFNRMRNGEKFTSSNNGEEFYYENFKIIAEKGYDIVHVELSGGITNSPFNALKACERIRDEYPEGEFYVLDSKNASVGQGFTADYAALLRDTGQSAKEIYDTLERDKIKIHAEFTTGDMSHLYRGGRISKFSSIVGTTLNIHPVMCVSKDGELKLKTKCRGVKNAITALIDAMEAQCDGGVGYTGNVFLVHSDNEKDVNTLREGIIKRFPNVNRIDTFTFHYNIGVHIGPGAVGLAYWGESRD